MMNYGRLGSVGSGLSGGFPAAAGGRGGGPGPTTNEADNCCAASLCGTGGPCEDGTTCGVACGGGAGSAMSYVGSGMGEYIQETTYRRVGPSAGGNYDLTTQPRRDFTCLFAAIIILSVLLLAPLFIWVLPGLPVADIFQTSPNGEVFNCNQGFAQWEHAWSAQQQDYCCAKVGRGCRPGGVPRPPVAPTGGPPSGAVLVLPH